MGGGRQASFQSWAAIRQSFQLPETRICPWYADSPTMKTSPVTELRWYSCQQRSTSSKGISIELFRQNSLLCLLSSSGKTAFLWAWDWGTPLPHSQVYFSWAVLEKIFWGHFFPPEWQFWSCSNHLGCYINMLTSLQPMWQAATLLWLHALHLSNFNVTET